MTLGGLLACGPVAAGVPDGGAAAPDGWIARAPRAEICPAFSYYPNGGPKGTGSLVIEADRRERLFGWWEKSVPVRGDWEGLQVLQPEAGRQVTRDAGTPGNGGIGWWNNSEGQYRSLPLDAYFGAGAGCQVVLIIPNLKLIAVRNGGSLDPSLNMEKGLETYLFDPLMRAVTER